MKKLKKIKRKLTSMLSSKLTQIKSALAKLKRTAMSSVSDMLNMSYSVSLILLNIGVLVYLILKIPEAYNLVIRSYVGSKVYVITNSRERGGGTGFAVKADSGVTYIVTNAHVCDISTDKLHVVVKNDWGLRIKRRILEVSDKSDLCLVEGIPGVDGLSLGDEPLIGTYLTSVGHPSLMPLTLSKGEFISKEDVFIFKGFIKEANDDKDSSGKDNNNNSNDSEINKQSDTTSNSHIMRIRNNFTSRELHNILNKENKTLQSLSEVLGTISPSECLTPNLIKIDTPFGKACFAIVKGAYATNMLGQPGGSGSPVVNFWGNVVGVVFAMDQYAWVRVVSLDDLKDLLRNF